MGGARPSPPAPAPAPPPPPPEPEPEAPSEAVRRKRIQEGRTEIISSVSEEAGATKKLLGN